MSIHWFKAARKRQHVTHARGTPFLAAIASCAVVGAGALISAGPLAPAAHAAEECGSSPTPTFFTDEVGQPPVAAPDAPNHYTLTAHLGAHQFPSGWPAVPTLGYSTANATVNYLGPTIVTKKGQPIDVTLANGLPAAGTAMFPFDQPNDNNAVVMHRHGGLAGGSRRRFAGTTDPAGRLAHQPLPEQPGGRAAVVPRPRRSDDLIQRVRGTGRIHAQHRQPRAAVQPAERELRQGLRAAGQVVQRRPHALLHPREPGVLRGPAVVNGTIAPIQQVEPRRYTFTFINGSDSRFYHLTLQQTGGAAGASAPQMTVVGSDSGYVLHPAKVSDLLIAPGERYKMVVDFTGHTGQNWVLANDAATPYPDDDPDVAKIPQLMWFQVSSTLSSG